MKWYSLACVVFIIVPLAGCVDESIEAGSYGWPVAIIGMPVTSETEPEIRAALAAFAERHELTVYRVTDDPRASPARRENPRRQILTQYQPRRPRVPTGTSVELLEISMRCWMIRFYERSRRWTRSSVDRFDEIYDDLRRATDNQAVVFVPPALGGDVTHSYEPGSQAYAGGVPLELRELCPTMGVG